MRRTVVSLVAGPLGMLGGDMNPGMHHGHSICMR
jgi:hypothetical protein